MPHYIIKRLNLPDVKPGMVVGAMLLTEKGRLALDVGTVLTENLIERLVNWGIRVVDVRLEAEEPEPPAWRGLEVNPALLERQRKFDHGYEDTVRAIKTSFDTMRYFREVPIHDMKELAETSIDSLIELSGVVNHLHMARRPNDYTFCHSVNVAVLCGVLGRWLGYTGEVLKSLILAGLLHDVGKTQVPLSILNKPGKLSSPEMESVKQHTTLGYKMVRDIPGLTEDVLFGVLQHHERMDGSGYPFRVPGEKIHPFGKIIAIADIYDAMTSDRVYHNKVTPFEVVASLWREMYDKLDPGICGVFLNNVRDYFLGNHVELSDGREAEVVLMGQTAADRPVVRANDGTFIDLEKDKNISIVKLTSA
ncbi:Hypothetical protein LUCI_2094 [Lucifera butyrica]|uniref:HD-GYP domain-containing protein n=1 Tax=Lucifera butyrica TaxID=1351585 RepID=A0A498R7H9_9FIRM|nr:HD-GYP domain-containing protein [Lucifera butyrica]VBB06857.1 Hypothetical protein LUCI_2094 [Lucifera butyrica]